jgi:Transglutaminase-like superfamily
MFLLVCRAYLQLIRIDLPRTGGDFAALYLRIQGTPLRPPVKDTTAEMICRAVDLASIWYWKQVSCLHRSAATTCLLRRRGVAAQLVIGAQCIPFRAHAWVEVDGRVVNDKPYISELYAVVDRC